MKKLLLIFGITSIIVGVIALALYVNKNGKNSQNGAGVAVDTAQGTSLQIRNDYDSAVVVYVTLGAVSGCIQSVLDLPFGVDTVPGAKGLQGTFILQAHDSTAVFNSDSVGFNGVISFGYAPDNCPSPRYQLGLNQFEFMINNSFQEGNPQESINISAVHGVNCVIRCNVETDSLEVFNAGPDYPVVQSFANTLNRSQVGLIGVYPYGCDVCTASVAPPNCIPVPQPAQKKAICQVQRPAKKGNSGLITVIYLGQSEPLK
jgi:hypothetical protein